MRGMKPIATTLFRPFFPSPHGISRLTPPNLCAKPRIRAFPVPRTGILPRGQNGPHCNLSPAAELEELRFRILRDLCVHGWSCTAFGQTGFRAQPTQQALDLTAAI
jgi:hypothetical protein